MKRETLIDQDVLLTLVDGDLISLAEDHYSSKGCPTCNYNSSYVQDFTVVTSKGKTRFELEQMYSYPITHDYLFKTILPNVDKIKAMTIDEFLAWLEDLFRKAGDEWCHPKMEITRE